MGWGWYPPSNPRRPAHGIRAQSQRGQFGKTWWASHWLRALEELVDPARLGRGRSYARSGQVLEIDIEEGQVNSRVQGSRPTPYDVMIQIKPLSKKEWEKVADVMARQAVFAAKLLAGEMPQNIQEAFSAAGVSLFPTDEEDLITACSCPDWANPCKHIAAVYYLLGEQFDADPFLIFRLRGKTKNEIVSMLRARRTGAESVPAKPEPARVVRRKKEKPKPEKIVPLAQSLDRFWTAPDPLDDFHVEIKGSPVDALPVKRLGTPGFWRERADFLQCFDSAYHDIAGTALALVTGEKAKKR